MSTMGAQFLHLACQGGRLVPCPPPSVTPLIRKWHRTPESFHLSEQCNLRPFVENAAEILARVYVFQTGFVRYSAGQLFLGPDKTALSNNWR